MRDRDLDLAKLIDLPVFGGRCNVAWSEGGGGDVIRYWDMLFLFEIPMYGGEGTYSGAYHIKDAAKLVEEAYSWA